MDLLDVTILLDFKLVASDDPVKTDLELTCLRCGERLCDAEDDDTLSVLVGMARDHVCAE